MVYVLREMIYILATDSTPDSKGIHTANVLAQCLDNDQDGDPDNEIVLDEILEFHDQNVVREDVS